MANYEKVGKRYRCFIDNQEYDDPADIPDYGDWAVVETQGDFDPKCYAKGAVADLDLLPSDHEVYGFLKSGCTAITTTNKVYFYNANVKEWQSLS